jgi:hypothetical protein
MYREIKRGRAGKRKREKERRDLVLLLGKGVEGLFAHFVARDYHQRRKIHGIFLRNFSEGFSGHSR